jgi:hypothetical protein
MKKLFLVLFLLLAARTSRAQTTVTAASCSYTDVNAVINGPTHVAISGDKIIVPATGSPCTWLSGITINSVGIDITGIGTPNTGGGTVGAGTPNVTIIEAGAGANNYNQAPANGTALFYFTGLSFGQTAKVELLNLSASGAASLSILSPIQFAGTCTVSGCANIRVDNINFISNTWETPMEAGFIATNDVFGVIDHNSATENASNAPTILQNSYVNWQGAAGDNGDNSFASPDTFGTIQEMYVENNHLDGVRGSENDVGPYGNNNGGARYVVRFNTFFTLSGTGACTAHGTSWTGRQRGQRQVECYYNTINGTGCNAYAGLNSGTGMYFSNSITIPGGGCNNFVDLDIVRFDTSPAPAPVWGACGTGPWDQVFTSTSRCLDQPGSGMGNLLAGGTALSAAGSTMTPPGVSCNGAAAPTCYPAGVLDPVYEAGDTLAAPGSFPVPPVRVSADGSSTRVLSDHDYYMEVAMTAQTNSTTPFNGSTGTGFGTLANRPSCSGGCLTGVGYWATDQGAWNTFDSRKGILYTWNGSSWVTKFTPYNWPHPLTVSNVVSLSPSGENFGSVNVGSSSSPVTFTLSNSSGVTATSISPIITGGNSGDFSIINSGAGSCAAGGGSLASGNSCTFTVTFTPGATGSRSSTASVSYSGGDGASPQTAALSGTGTTSGAVSLTPSSNAFGSVIVGIPSSAATFTLSNTTGVSVTSIVVTFTGTNGSDFSRTGGTCGTSLVNGSSCTIFVEFTPGATGSRSGSLNVADSDSSSPQTASLSGTGINGTVTLTPTTQNFGSEPVGTPSAPFTFTLTNTNAFSVTGITVSFVGGNNSDFYPSGGTCGSSLPGNSSCTIILLFQPTAGGARASALNVADSASSSPQQSFLSGTGGAAVFTSGPSAFPM